MLKREPFLNVAANSIAMSLETEDGSQLSLGIPRDILDAKHANGTDFNCMVHVDGRPIDYQEITINITDVEASPAIQQSRQISFFVPPGSTSLEFFGTDVL